MAGILGGIGTALGWRGDAQYKIPKWSPLDISGEQGKSIQANLTNLPKAEELTGQVNTFNFDQLMGMLRKAIPGYDSIVGKQSEVLQSRLKGEVPKDVADLLQSRAASKSITGGYGGSEAAANLEARDFGLTSMDITNKALNSASAWIESMGRLTQPGMMNVTSSFLTPAQWFAQTNLDKENLWKVQMMKNIEAAKPTNLERGGMQALDAVDQLAASAASYGLGGLMGGGSTNAPQTNWTGGSSGNYLAASSPGFGSGGPYE